MISASRIDRFGPFDEFHNLCPDLIFGHLSVSRITSPFFESSLGGMAKTLGRTVDI